MYKNTYSKNFVVTLALLPAMVQIVILLVNGNLGTGVAVVGAFSLVRFRSVPGSAREISAIFFAMAIGLICGSYSSVAVATPLYAMWKTREPRNAKLVKKYGTEVGRFEFANPNAMAAAAAKPAKAAAGKPSKGAPVAKPASKAAEATAAAKKNAAPNGSAAPSAAPGPSSAERPHGASASKAGSKPPKAKRKKRPDKK